MTGFESLKRKSEYPNSKSTLSEEEYERRKQEKFERELSREIAGKQRNRMEKELRESGLDRMISEKRFDNFTVKDKWQERARNMCMDFADNPKGWLLLSGQSGSGKTHLCTAVAKSLIDKGMIVTYVLYRDSMTKLKPMNGNSYDAERLMRKLKNAEVLYIDDLFKGGVTDADVRLMFELIDHRYRAKSITIISTELTIDDIEEVDEAIAGRIMELSKKVMIKKDKIRNFRFLEWRKKK